MADLISDGKTRVAWAASITNINAPTVAELNAAADYTQRVTPDGLKLDPSTADVDDLPFTTLKYGVSGYLIVRRAVAYATAWTAGQKVEVYPITCGEPANASPAANEVMKFMSPMKVTAAPATAATVAA
jgi:hypothetical protein